jgi:hypothetical protein
MNPKVSNSKILDLHKYEIYLCARIDAKIIIF